MLDTLTHWGDDMRLAGLVAITTLVLVTLVSALPQVIATQSRDGERSSNMEDHFSFTKELADHGAKLDILQRQHEAMARLPERLARVEERIDGLVKMVYAILGGVFALLLKEIWSAMRAIRGRRQEG